MKIYPISINQNLHFSSNKINSNILKNEISKAQSPNLVTYIPLMSNKMKIDENIKFFLKGLNKIDTNSKRNNKPIKIADIGCCDGSLCRTLRKYIPYELKIFGLDLSKEMLESAKLKDKLLKVDSEYVIGNALKLPYKNNKMDAILLSSVMHEIYSYPNKELNTPKYSIHSIELFLQEAYQSLKPGGVLIIKDPATPHIDRLEKITICNANKNDGQYPPIEDMDKLKQADITKLSTYDKLKRFCTDFQPALDKTYFNEHNECIMPRWLVTEFVRHRKWLATPENWNYEIREQYGTITPDQMSEIARKIGFNIIEVENIFISNKNNIYAIKENEFEIRDLENNILTLEDFPMFLEVILKKSRNDSLKI
ncbi:methyltransferase domain-containing protein [bacterium]|nr:methyltransferase domain-containing protein [bacterium]